jgi:hypothetical protein
LGCNEDALLRAPVKTSDAGDVYHHPDGSGAGAAVGIATLRLTSADFVVTG